MAKDAYHELFLHAVWHTQANRHLIAPALEADLHAIIRRRALDQPGVFVHEIGGTENHVHIVARVPPTVAPADWIGKIKGGSSYDANRDARWNGCMHWQGGYGVVSFGAKDLDWVVAYVRNQKQHHRNGTIFDRLERITNPEG